MVNSPAAGSTGCVSCLLASALGGAWDTRGRTPAQPHVPQRAEHAPGPDGPQGPGPSSNHAVPGQSPSHAGSTEPHGAGTVFLGMDFMAELLLCFLKCFKR